MTTDDNSKQSTKRKDNLTPNQVAKVKGLPLFEDVPAALWEKVVSCPYLNVECKPFVAARIGQRCDLECRTTLRNRAGHSFPCRQKASVVWGDAPPAFLRPDAAGVNETKASVLSALSRLGGTATAQQIARESGLPESRVQPYLHSAAHRSMPYVSKSAERMPQAIGSAFAWTLEPRGYLWLHWAAERGLVTHGKG